MLILIYIHLDLYIFLKNDFFSKLLLIYGLKTNFNNTIIHILFIINLYQKLHSAIFIISIIFYFFKFYILLQYLHHFYFGLNFVTSR